MATIGERIVERAFEILDASPEGVRYSDLIRHIIEADPSFNHNTVGGIPGISMNAILIACTSHHEASSV